MRIPFRLLAAVLLLAACGNNPVEPLPEETSVTFQYRLGTGVWQNFSARGQQPDGTPYATRGHWVFTAGEAPTIVVAPHQPSGNGGWVSFLAYVPHVATIDSVFLVNNMEGTCPGGPCTQGYLFIASPAGEVVESCTIDNGMMHITRRTVQWVSGDFSGTGTCRAGGASRPFEVREGAFDVELPAPVGAPG